MWAGLLTPPGQPQAGHSAPSAGALGRTHLSPTQYAHPGGATPGERRRRSKNPADLSTLETPLRQFILWFDQQPDSSILGSQVAAILNGSHLGMGPVPLDSPRRIACWLGCIAGVPPLEVS